MQAYCISPNQQVFRKYSKFCSLVTKCFLGSDEMASPAGFVSWTIVWRPWLSALKCSVKSLKSMRGWQAMLHQRAVDIPAFIKKKQFHLSRIQISPWLVLCSDTAYYCTFVNIYTTVCLSPQESVWNCRQLRARGITQFFYFCDDSEDIVKFLLLSLAQGASRCAV